MNLLQTRRTDRRTGYHPNAYRFLFAALNYTQESLGQRSVLDYLEDPDAGDFTVDGPTGHVSGRQLCEGIREYALGQFGLLARTVFENWNIRGTRDFGEMVYELVEMGEMRTTAEDSIEDFDDVFDFETGLAECYRVETGKAFA